MFDGMSTLTADFDVDLNRELFAIGKTSVTLVSLGAFALTILLTIVISGLLRRAIMRFFRHSQGPAYAVGRIVQIVVVLSGLMVALDNVGVDMTALATIGAVLTVGIGLALQDVARNFVSGLVLLAERPVQRGDFVVVGDAVGEVRDISLRATRLLTRDGVLLIVPNSQFATNSVINRSQPNNHYRARIAVGVDYGSDPELVREALLAVAEEHERVLQKPVPEVYFRDFAESALAFELCVWLPEPQIEYEVLSNLRFAIIKAFRERAISIPFPQRDLHLRTASDGAVLHVSSEPDRAA